jgi:hypothetical protein
VPSVDTPEDSAVELTMEMLRAGIDAYRDWDPDQEEVAALVGSIFVAMAKASGQRTAPKGL